MNITFQTYGKAGTALRVVITHSGKVYRKGLGISADKWNQKRQKSGLVEIDEAVKKIHIGLESVLNEYSSSKDISGALERIEGGKWKEPKPKASRGKNALKTPTFAEFWETWVNSKAGAKRQLALAGRVVLSITGENVGWDDFDNALYVRLITEFNKRGYRPNYQCALIGRLKTCLNEAHALRYISNTDYREWKKPKEKTFAVALTDDEIRTIENFETDNKVMAKTRDMFLLGFYTAARFSDYSRMTLDDIVDGNIRFVQKKTENAIVIPCSPKVRTILERYGGKAPHIIGQVFNRDIKRLCKLVGMDYPIQVPPTIIQKLKKKKGEQVYKYELISSHTCRRTAISKLYRDGVPAGLICKVSGHKTEKQLMDYVKITADEAATQLRTLDFFK